MNVLSNVYPTAALREADARHHWHPFTDTAALNVEGARVIVAADGVWLTDSDGNRILDGMAGLWCTNIGHGREEIAEAVYAQMKELGYYNTFFKTTHPPVIKLSELLSEVTPPHLNRVFFCGSGSEANDTIVRMVRTYWQTKGKPEKQTIISRHNAYHGSTVAGASLGGMGGMHAQGGLPIPGIHHIAQPYWYGEGGDLSPEEFGLWAARELERAIDALGEDKVAAFIAEPIQGAGGVIVPPDSYWPEIKRICSEREILFIADEVICGFGRLGAWFGSDYYGLKPDLMPIAKGLSSGYLPIGGVMMADHVAETLEQGGEFAHGYTYSGHPVCCAAAIANINILKREGIVERVASDTGPYLQRKWLALGEHPLVGEARMVGMVGALELAPAKPDRTKRFEPVGDVGTLCRDISFKNGLVMRAVRDSMIVSPPLVITREEIDDFIERVEKTLDATLSELTKAGLMG
ncbi:putrescine aminotransferase [Rhodobium orientis]|uniref:Aspartate aminotransferase family protein n=1 Tax=Rhodobium orientis TaxID=34017 RepID=A0A327JJE1_9HYPH|nr:aspartate aminotransferase family protein [Rhodobium orientis]MBB4304980.1 putrescine aminotransferase [Rhodobium orientis]MBK5948812.1 aspartate aminotransferase family protein [Rhodobium orientis]RAI26429.1 aspartate aminotransferase family protein [Rhodobium orientis]